MASKLFLLRPTLGQGGADRVTLTLLQTFDRQQFAPILVLMHREGAYLDDVPVDVPVYHLGGKSLWAAWRPLTGLLRQHRPDVLFSTASGTNVIAVIASMLARFSGRLVLSERNVLLHGRITWKKRLMLWAKRLLYTRADVVTAVSQGVKDDLIARLHLPVDKIQVVYNPIVTPDLPQLAAEPLNHPWLADDVPIILGAGRLVEEKDFPTLVHAFALVWEQRPCRLLILGEGDGRQELVQLAKKLGIEADVDMPGFDKNPFKYMARCTVFVLSSRFEGLPGVLIQAMACGAPVIATDCPSGPAEIITVNGEDGFLTPVGDAQAIAEKILFLLDNPGKRESMARHGRQSGERFHVETVMSRYVAAIEGTM
ncbi:MAG TPA: glycosyltransferase [Chloroflexota bacterium]|nr:glycosyltransferase [Chloroflexota bacterium]HUM67760.1 glycosyltransferase [Chloroflexota bacterium]